jgi:hypothetical protein
MIEIVPLNLLGGCILTHVPSSREVKASIPALPERAGVGSIPANSDAQKVPSFRLWRFEMKLSPLF